MGVRGVHRAREGEKRLYPKEREEGAGLHAVDDDFAGDG
jgi:hypothetical protein